MSARFVSSRELIRTAAERWDRQYERHIKDGRLLVSGKSAGDISKALHALDPETASSDDVAEIIGNRSWTQKWCSICQEYCESAIEIGDDYPRYLCRPCIEKLPSMFVDPQVSDARSRSPDSTITK